MPHIILKERTADVGSYARFLLEMLINIKTRHFHSFSKHREHLFDRTLSLATFVL